MKTKKEQKVDYPKMGKIPQRKKSLVCNPESSQYNPTVAKRRLKEKNRRKAAKRNRGK